MLVHSDDGAAGYASGGDGLPDRGAARAAAARRRPAAHRGACASICETVDFHGGRPWAVEFAVLGSRRPRAGRRRCWRLLGGRASGSPRTPRRGELLDRRPSARERALALRERGVRAIKLRFHHDDWREDVEVVAAVRDAVGARARADGRREPGLADAGRPRRRAGTSRPRPRARARSRSSTSTGSRSRCPRDDVEGYRAAARERTGIRLAAGEMVRTAARGARPRRCAAASTCCSPTSCSRGGIAGCRRLAALAELRGRMVAAHVVERLRPGREPARAPARSPRVRTSRCRSTRRPGRPSGATGCCPRRSRSPPTARSRRRPAPAWASSPTWTRSSGGGSA